MTEWKVKTILTVMIIIIYAKSKFGKWWNDPNNKFLKKVNVSKEIGSQILKWF